MAARRAVPYRRHGTGSGPFALFSAAGVVGLFAVEALLATCVAVLALVLPVWTAALAITGVIAAMAAVTLATNRDSPWPPRPTSRP
ncbi:MULTISPECIES: phage holin family protein [unclassified Streptomyces]|uniref:phage holin family protein n=1 Tax=unclassified Streptomyces TaxID=2593676 RepID=UPI00068C8B34|nr:phage holin family protein [Streptomyces sp. NRRL F-2747]